MIFTGGRGKSAAMNVKYTFQGVREQSGHREGVINLVGVAKDRLPGGLNVTGQVVGTAYLDLAAFQISSAHVQAQVTASDGRGSDMKMVLESKMERTLGKDVLNLRGQLKKDDPLDDKQRPFKAYSAQLEAGKPCVVSLESPKGANWFDTYVRVEDASGKVLAEDDNKGVDTNSLVMFTPPESGAYRIVVTCARPATGNYLLVVRQ